MIAVIAANKAHRSKQMSRRGVELEMNGKENIAAEQSKRFFDSRKNTS